MGGASSGSRGTWWAVGLLILAVALGAAWWLAGRGEEGTEETATGAGRPLASTVAEGPTLTGELRPPPSRVPVEPSAKATASDAPKPQIAFELLVRDVADQRPVPGLALTARWTYYEQQPGTQGHALNLTERTLDVEAATDADGLVRMLAPAGQTTAPFTVVVGRAWHVTKVALPGAEPAWSVELDATTPTRLEVLVRRSFHLMGRVVDPEGRALKGVQVSFQLPQRHPNSLVIGNVISYTDAEGRFDVGPLPEDPVAGFAGASTAYIQQWSHVVFALQGWATLRLDPRQTAPEARADFVVTLTRGATLAGVLVDARGRPLADVPVAVEYGDLWDLRRGTRTDADGRWRLAQLAPGPAKLTARAFAHDAKVVRELVIGPDVLDMRLVADDIRLSRPPSTTRVLGLALCDVDDELRAAYDVPDYVKVLMWEVGPEADALGIGRLERGYGLWIVGETRAESVRDAVERLLRAPEGQNDSMQGSKRVVYTFWNERMHGTNTQYVRMTPERRLELEAALERLPR
jgi:hypothetical protein